MSGHATLLLLDVPMGTVIGIDKKKHLSGPKFKGITSIPAGPHIITFNSIGSQGDFSPTISFFAFLKPSEVLVRRWDSSSEMLLPLQKDDEVEQYRKGVESHDFGDGLGPYDLAAYKEWQALTSCIDSETISRLSPLNGGFISITAEAAPATEARAEEKLSEQLRQADLEGQSSHSSTVAREFPRCQAPEAAEGISRGQNGKGGRAGGGCSGTRAQESGVGPCYYTSIPRHVKGEGRSPSEITAASLDKSQLLESLLKQRFAGGGRGLIGELQFAFLAFFIGQSLEGFRQWKLILHLVLSCEAAPLGKLSALYAKLLTTVEVQLRSSLGASDDAAGTSEQPGPLGVPMVDELLGDSFLKHLFRQFFEMLAEADVPVPHEVQAAATSIQKLLEKELGWDFRFQEVQAVASDDEYAPTYVEV